MSSDLGSKCKSQLRLIALPVCVIPIPDCSFGLLRNPEDTWLCIYKGSSVFSIRFQASQHTCRAIRIQDIIITTASMPKLLVVIGITGKQVSYSSTYLSQEFSNSNRAVQSPRFIPRITDGRFEESPATQRRPRPGKIRAWRS
jgi:hypothetical protein